MTSPDLVTGKQDDPLRIVHGDCIEVMRSMDEASVDAVVTDPPYGIRFMGQAWDGQDIEARVVQNARKSPVAGRTRPDGTPRSEGRAMAAGTYGLSMRGSRAFQLWSEAWAHEALRVLKPGRYMLVFGGTRTFHRVIVGIEDAGFEVRDCLMWLQGQGFPKSKALLKPAYEPIVLARKPGPLTHLNIDETRIPGKWTTWRRSDGTVNPQAGFREQYVGGKRSRRDVRNDEHPAGRWPANVVLDEEAAAMLDEQSGERPSGKMHAFHRNGPQRKVYGKDALAGYMVGETYGDTGGASRFFYTAKADKQDRGKGNTHPTVKPVDLMRWLVRLVTPAGGLVLDPFAGSGTTGQAALAEGFRCVLIEKEAEYVAGIEKWRAGMQLGFGVA